MTCTVSGSILDLQDQPVPGGTITFSKQDPVVRSGSSGVHVPNPVEVTPDDSGLFSVDLVAGSYVATFKGGPQRRTALLVVPDQATANLRDILTEALPEDTDAVTQAVLASQTARSKAEDFATASAESAGEAETAEAKAQKWAEEEEDAEVEPGQYSALHHAAKATAQAVIAATEAGNAADVLAAIELIFDSFDDRMLGSFSTANEPTTDNDGDPLIVGTIYYNTDELELRFWTPGGWNSPEGAAEIYANQALQAANTATTKAGEASDDADATATDREQTGLDVIASAANVAATETARDEAVATVTDTPQANSSLRLDADARFAPSTVHPATLGFQMLMAREPLLASPDLALLIDMEAGVYYIGAAGYAQRDARLFSDLNELPLTNSGIGLYTALDANGTRVFPPHHLGDGTPDDLTGWITVDGAAAEYLIDADGDGYTLIFDLDVDDGYVSSSQYLGLAGGDSARMTLQVKAPTGVEVGQTGRVLIERQYGGTSPKDSRKGTADLLFML